MSIIEAEIVDPSPRSLEKLCQHISEEDDNGFNWEQQMAVRTKEDN